MTTTDDVPKVIYDYTIEFVDDDTRITIVITDETANLSHEIITNEAEKRLCEMWGVKEVPKNYDIVNVKIDEVTI